MTPDPFLSDGVVALRPVARADLPLLAAWRNQPDVRLRTREWRPLTEEDQARWYERITAPGRRDFMFVITVDGDQPIGVVGVCHWDAHNRHGEMSFYIGDKSARGRGLCKRAVTLVTEWAFKEMHAHRIFAEVYDFNLPSYALLNNLGYRPEGVLRDNVERSGMMRNSYLLGLLDSEWGMIGAFWRNVNKSSCECWLWGGFITPDGYGLLNYGKRSYLAHRLSWELREGAIPAGLCVCHKCDVRHCVRPDHLFLGTNDDNIADAKRKGRYDRSPSSAEARAKISAANKGRKHGPEWVERCIAPLRGRVASLETRARMRASSAVRWRAATAEERVAIRDRLAAGRARARAAKTTPAKEKVPK